MKCFSKISIVILSLFSLSKGVVIQTNDGKNVDLDSIFSNIIGKNDAPATQVAGVTASPTEIDDEYTPEDIRKYTKFLLNVVSSENAATTTTTAVAAPTTPASELLGDIKNLSAELDQIKERRVDEIDELIDIIKNVSSRLENLENTVEQQLTKQGDVANTVPDTKDVDLNNAEFDNANITPITETDLKYAAIFDAFNKKNEEKIAEMQQNELKLLEEIKGLLSNNNNITPVVNADNTKAIVDKEVVINSNEEVNAAPPPETTEEALKEQVNAEAEVFDKLYEDLKKDIDDYKTVVAQSSENVSSDEQFTQAAMIRDKTKSIKQYINKLASLAKNEDQKNKLKQINDKFDSVESVHIEKVNNDEEVAKDEAAAKETAKETADEAKAQDLKNVVSIDNVKKVINKVAASTTNEQEVDEVQRIIKEIQLNEKAENVQEQNEDDSVENALFKVASNTVNQEQVEEVRKFIKSIEAKAVLDSNLKKDEVIRKLIYDISANTTNEDQVKQVQRILEKIQLYNKFAEDTQQEREDNLAFGQEMAAEIVKTPDEISNDLKTLLVNLVNNAKTDEEASNVANIITQIKKHDQLIKEVKLQEQESEYVKIPNVESYIIENDDGTANEVFLREETELIPPAEPVEPVANIESTDSQAQEAEPVVEINLEDIEEPGNGKGMLVLGALGVIALAGVGYSYRSKARKLNDEFPFSDSNLPFSSSMNGLVVDKEFLYGNTEIAKPDHIINNDAVIRPSQPSWATSVLMDENNKKGLKETIQMIDDPEELLDEQLNKIQNKEKVIVKSNIPSVVITIDDNNATTKELPEIPKQKAKKEVKKPKLRRSIGSISLDKKIKEDREEANEKKSRKSKKHQKKEKSRKTKKEEQELDEETELSFNTSFILDAPSLLFDEEDEKSKKILLDEKPKVPKRISSCASECPFTDDFAKELMEDYNKKFGEMEKEN